MSIKFNILHTDKKSRSGMLETLHASVETPVFMPVGTKATVKGITPSMLHDIGFDIILANTYHLMLQPTESIIEKQGGLHKFSNWNKAILTDSGGFQVMSLSGLRKITEDYVEFRSHINGSIHKMSPEYSVQIQHKLDSNITMVLDECVSYPADISYVESSTDRTTRWALRSKNAFVNREGYGIFGIMQGGFNENLRTRSANELIDIGFDGYAIGGLAIGESKDLMLQVLSYAPSLLPENKPRYLMGVGRPIDILNAIEMGVDMFDCVIPTRMGRNARAFTSMGEVNIRNAKHTNDSNKLDDDCNCYCCSNYGRAYLHHLFKADEMMGPILLSLHNLSFYHNLIKESRKAIKTNCFSEYKNTTLAKMVLDIK